MSDQSINSVLVFVSNGCSLYLAPIDALNPACGFQATVEGPISGQIQKLTADGPTAEQALARLEQVCRTR